MGRFNGTEVAGLCLQLLPKPPWMFRCNLTALCRLQVNMLEQFQRSENEASHILVNCRNRK